MSGYDQFFKQARQASSTGANLSVKQKPKQKPAQSLTVRDLEKQLQLKVKRKKKFSIPWKLAGVSFVGLMIMLWGFQNIETVEKYVKSIEIDFLGHAQAEAASKDTTPAAKTVSNSEKAENQNPQKELSGAESAPNMEYLSKLNQRKKELDSREEELNRMETELQKQKTELETKIVELEKMRRSISSVLEEKIQKDNQKIDELVQMYTSMKPPQAAKVLESMDENLVVEILSKMKKKSAAEIMNLLKPEKAQSISEKYAGYKIKQ